MLCTLKMLPSLRLGHGWTAGFRKIIGQADRTRLRSTFPDCRENSRGKRIWRRIA
jgi:hypothetical protein